MYNLFVKFLILLHLLILHTAGTESIEDEPSKETMDINSNECRFYYESAGFLLNENVGDMVKVIYREKFNREL